MTPKGGSHLCLKCSSRTANNHSSTGGRMGKCSLTFILTNLHIPTACVITQPGEGNPATGERGANLAVPGRNRLGVVTIVEAVNAVLKFLAY